jgi:capsular polysaccharide transport system permease protein
MAALFLKQLGIQRRVIGALIMREIYSRFGREGLGFVWALTEPMVFAVPVLLVWSVARGKFEHGLPMLPLLWSGYLPILLFRHLGGASLRFIRANTHLLYHRRVTLFDIFLARALIEIGTNLLALGVTFILFASLGEMQAPRDLPMFFIGYLYAIWWCVTVGLVIGALSERSNLVEKIWVPYSYLYMFFSGFFFLAVWLPPRLREWALYQPSLQTYEMIRRGVFGSTVNTYYDMAYTTAVLAALTLIGLWALRDGRRFVIVE